MKRSNRKVRHLFGRTASVHAGIRLRQAIAEWRSMTRQDRAKAGGWRAFATAKSEEIPF